MKRIGFVLCVMCACSLGAEVKTYWLKEGRKIVGAKLGGGAGRIMLRKLNGERATPFPDGGAGTNAAA